MEISVDSEIGKLRQVILHRPGNEMLRLTPQNKDHLLFDDVLWLERAQEEHDQFARVLTDRDIEVLYLSDLLAQTLEVPEARQYVLDRVVNENTNGPSAAEPLRALAQGLSGAELAEVLVAGITKAELLERTSCPDSLVLASMDDDDLLLPPLPNHLFTRDTSCWIYNGVSINSMMMPARQRETINYEAIYRWHPLFAGSDFPVWSEGTQAGPATVEGGDVQIIGNGAVLVGVSERTTSQGIERLASRLFAGGKVNQIVAVEMNRTRAQMHLDTVMTMVDVGTFTIYGGLRSRCAQTETSRSASRATPPRTCTASSPRPWVSTSSTFSSRPRTRWPPPVSSGTTAPTPWPSPPVSSLPMNVTSTRTSTLLPMASRS